MKKFYPFLAAVLLLCANKTLLSQTAPTVQTLPFSFTEQSSSTLTQGMVVHRFGTTSTAIPTTRTTSPGNGDLLYVSLGTSGGWRDEKENGLSLLASGSQSAGALVIAVNTVGKKNIQVNWKVKTILQQAARDNSIALQYRIGNTGNFINVGSSVYSSTGKLVNDAGSFSEFLPGDAENKSEVQVRWIYWESVNTSGSRDRLSIDDISIDGTGGDFSAPTISSSIPADNATGVLPNIRPSIQFSESIKANTDGSYYATLYDVTKNTQQKFLIGSSSVTITGSTLTLNTALKSFHSYYIELDDKAVTDLSGNAFAGLSGNTGWNFTTGEQQLVFDFNDCNGASLSGGFTQFSKTGSVTWACTTFGQTGGGFQINGFINNATQENEDWLITPAFDLSYFNFPLLSYATRSRFAGSSLTLKVSVDYSGVGDPGLATWTTIKGRFPKVDSDVWTTSSDINLSAFKGENVYIAFVYTSSLADGASRWTVDDFKLVNAPTAPAPGIVFGPAELDFDYAASGTKSLSQEFTITPYNLQSDLTITAPAGFEVSLNNNSFSSSVSIQQSIAESTEQTIYARFAPTTVNQEYTGSVTVTGAGLSKMLSLFTGSSLRALKVVNWNIEWFGSPEQNPANDNLQQQNVQTILKKLNADIFALAEVVDTLRLKQMVDAMPGYAYTVSDFGSYTNAVNDPDYKSAQKLAFVYKESVVKKLDAYGVLRFGGSVDASYHWSSGRFPYLLKAQVSLEGITTTVDLVLLHAKANTGTNADKIEAWERRKAGAEELKDSLDLYYPYANLVILGDFNDDLDQTIAPSIPGNITSYIDFINDPVDYRPLTLPLSLAGLRSTVSNDNVIDHQVASNEMGIAYVPNSAKILSSVSSWVSNYSSTTTDHYPVVARYDLSFFARPIDFNGFTGVVDKSTVRFTWNTLHEINSNYFVVERSRNGKDFVAIDSVKGQGDKRTKTSYQFNYNKPWPGQTHYRLRITSLDGTVYYSEVTTVNMKSASANLRVTSESKSTARIAFDTEEATNATVQLLDLNGRSYFRSPMTFIKGQNIRTISINNLPAGVYLVQIITNHKVETAKLFID